MLWGLRGWPIFVGFGYVQLWASQNRSWCLGVLLLQQVEAWTEEEKKEEFGGGANLVFEVSSGGVFGAQKNCGCFFYQHCCVFCRVNEPEELLCGQWLVFLCKKSDKMKVWVGLQTHSIPVASIRAWECRREEESMCDEWLAWPIWLYLGHCCDWECIRKKVNLGIRVLTILCIQSEGWVQNLAIGSCIFAVYWVY